jgi:hypothetical protein
MGTRSGGRGKCALSGSASATMRACADAARNEERGGVRAPEGFVIGVE